MITPIELLFEGDGIFPNSVLPDLFYKNALTEKENNLVQKLEDLFVSNNWTNNWRDIILSENHYHST